MLKKLILAIIMATVLLCACEKTQEVEEIQPTQEVTIEYVDPTVPKPFVKPDYLDDINDYNPSNIEVSDLQEAVSSN